MVFLLMISTGVAVIWGLHLTRISSVACSHGWRLMEAFARKLQWVLDQSSVVPLHVVSPYGLDFSQHCGWVPKGNSPMKEGLRGSTDSRGGEIGSSPLGEHSGKIGLVGESLETSLHTPLPDIFSTFPHYLVVLLCTLGFLFSHYQSSLYPKYLLWMFLVLHEILTLSWKHNFSCHPFRW